MFRSTKLFKGSGNWSGSRYFEIQYQIYILKKPTKFSFDQQVFSGSETWSGSGYNFEIQYQNYILHERQPSNLNSISKFFFRIRNLIRTNERAIFLLIGRAKLIFEIQKWTSKIFKLRQFKFKIQIWETKFRIWNKYFKILSKPWNIIFLQLEFIFFDLIFQRKIYYSVYLI